VKQQLKINNLTQHQSLPAVLKFLLVISSEWFVGMSI